MRRMERGLHMNIERPTVATSDVVAAAVPRSVSLRGS